MGEYTTVIEALERAATAMTTVGDELTVDTGSLRDSQQLVKLDENLDLIGGPEPVDALLAFYLWTATAGHAIAGLAHTAARNLTVVSRRTQEADLAAAGLFERVSGAVPVAGSTGSGDAWDAETEHGLA